MNAKNTSIRLAFAFASVLTTLLTLGSVVALAHHYGETAQWASAQPVIIAQR
jgi:hypothetical protein